MPKNNIIVLTSPPSAANNARRPGKQLMNGPEGGVDTPSFGGDTTTVVAFQIDWNTFRRYVMSNQISGRRVAIQTRLIPRVLLTMLGMLLAFPLAIHAQTYYGTIVGNVTDTTGAAVPAAKITVRNTGTNSTYTATTSGQGSYSVPQLAVGSYEVHVT